MTKKKVKDRNRTARLAGTGWGNNQEEGEGRATYYYCFVHHFFFLVCYVPAPTRFFLRYKISLSSTSVFLCLVFFWCSGSFWPCYFFC